MTDWVTKERYCAMSGLTDGQIRARIDRRKWIRGVHFVVDGKTTMINVREVERWWGEREELDPTKLDARFKSAGDTAVDLTPKRSTSGLRRLV